MSSLLSADAVAVLPKIAADVSPHHINHSVAFDPPIISPKGPNSLLPNASFSSLTASSVVCLLLNFPTSFVCTFIFLLVVSRTIETPLAPVGFLLDKPPLDPPASGGIIEGATSGGDGLLLPPDVVIVMVMVGWLHTVHRTLSHRKWMTDRNNTYNPDYPNCVASE